MHVCVMPVKIKNNITGCSNVTVQKSQKHIKFGNTVITITLTFSIFKLLVIKKVRFYVPLQDTIHSGQWKIHLGNSAISVYEFPGQLNFFSECQGN